MNWLRRADNSGIPLLLARLILGITMVLMGWAKVGDPVAFLKLLDQYHLFPPGWYVVQNVLAVCLPWIETIAGVLLIVGLFRRGSALLFLVLLTGFTIAIIGRAMDIHQEQGIPYSQIHFDCGCGSGDVFVKVKVPENIGLWLLSWICLLSPTRRFTLDRVLFPDRRRPAEPTLDAPPTVASEPQS
ncbi:MAG TPA: DoxX family protein [Phycisphaerae bacterium]|nr:DoxX family protein [Phycisphaerae bacterium]